jgi:hypothetical protein
MSLDSVVGELLVQEYYVNEVHVHCEDDSPAIGCYERHIRGRQQYGPFRTEKEATEEKEKLIQKELQQGWNRSASCADVLWRRGADEIKYSVEPKTRPMLAKELLELLR